jgi:uncharacterized protein YacL
LVQLLFILPISKWCMSNQIASMNIAYNDKSVETYFSDHTHSSPDQTVRAEDLRDMGFAGLFSVLASRGTWKALSVNMALILLGLLITAFISLIGFRHLLRFGERLSALTTLDKLCLVIGTILGIATSELFLPPFLGSNRAWMLIGGLIVTYAFIMVLMSMKDELKVYWPGFAKPEAMDKAFQKPKLLDTNVIIDGRVADVCSAGFVEGQIIVASFVLDELQHIADSADSLRRARGRRGLDILNQMRKELNLTVRQSAPVNAEDSDEVDARLVKLAKEIDGVIVTNDFNLNKVAELQGVPVMNINELANALKPVVLPGEELTVTVIKDGKEINQGIAYLDDGTMIVIEGARKHIGETVDAIVTSVLQTVAGKMIFATIKSIQEAEDNLIDRNVRNYSSFRPRKKTI